MGRDLAARAGRLKRRVVRQDENRYWGSVADAAEPVTDNHSNRSCSAGSVRCSGKTAAEHGSEWKTCDQPRHPALEPNGPEAEIFEIRSIDGDCAFLARATTALAYGHGERSGRDGSPLAFQADTGSEACNRRLVSEKRRCIAPTNGYRMLSEQRTFDGD